MYIPPGAHSHRRSTNMINNTLKNLTGEMTLKCDSISPCVASFGSTLTKTEHEYDSY